MNKPKGIRFLKHIMKYSKTISVFDENKQRYEQKINMKAYVDEENITVIKINFTTLEKSKAVILIQEWNDFITINLKKPYKLGLGSAVHYAYESLIMQNFKNENLGNTQSI